MVKDYETDINKKKNVPVMITGTRTNKTFAKDTTLTLGTITLTQGTWLIYFSGWVPYASQGVPRFGLFVNDACVWDNRNKLNVTQFSFSVVQYYGSQTTINITYNSNDNSSGSAGIQVSAIKLD